jgi:4-amino-4-deoxy-L-arabinose transferase-like glycosyltransferase
VMKMVGEWDRAPSQGRSRLTPGESGIGPSGIVALSIILAVAVALSVLSNPGVIRAPFAYEHAWPSAHWSVMARNFSDHTNYGQGLVPIQNNPPLLGEPDVYLHWPPLLTWSLALAFKLFGASESTTHLFMLCVLLGSASTVGLIAARFFGLAGGLFAGLVFLTAPVTLRFSFVAVPINLALLFLLLALYCMVLGCDKRKKRWTFVLAALGCFYMAVLATWEAALAAPGFVLAARLGAEKRTPMAALACGAAATMALITIFGVYFVSRPEQLQELWQVVGYRAGIAKYNPRQSTIYQIEKAVSLRIEKNLNLVLDDWMILRAPFVFIRRLQIFGQLGVVFLLSTGICLVWLRSERTRILLMVLAPLTSAWLLWALFMPNHYSMHEFEAVLGLPVVALGGGWMFKLASDLGGKLCEPTTRIALRAVMSLAVPLALILPLGDRAFVVHTKTEWQMGMHVVEYGRDIGTHTPAGSVVLQPSVTMVPVFYSGRHTVRGVTSDSSLSTLRETVTARFPKQDLFLAIMPEEKVRFPEAITQFPLVAATPSLLLFHLVEQPGVK